MIAIAIRIFAHVALVAWTLAIGLAQYWLHGFDKALPHVLLYGIAAWLVQPGAVDMDAYKAWLDAKLEQVQHG